MDDLRDKMVFIINGYSPVGYYGLLYPECNMIIYRKNKIIKYGVLPSVIYLMSIMSFAAVPGSAIFPLGPGFKDDTYTFNLSGNRSSMLYSSNDLWFLRSRTDGAGSGGTWGSSSDGAVKGWLLGNDMVLTLTGSLVYVGPPSDFAPDGTLSFSFTQAPSGTSNFKKYLGAGCTPNELCWGMTQYPGGSTYVPVGATITSSLQGKIYLGPAAQPGTYIIPSLELYSPWNMLGWVPLITSGTTITIEQPSVNCSIAPPSPVNFGLINYNDVTETLISFKPGDLTVSCDSSYGQAKTSLSISFNDNTGGGTGKIMRLKDSDGNIMANIKGRLASPLNGTCSSYVSNDVLFDGSVSKTISDVGIGQTIIPLTWSLCKYDSELKTGESTAQATVTVDWE